MSNAVVYTPSNTGRRLHRSPAFVRGVRGPVGAGKTTMCAMDIYLRAHWAEPCADGIRRTRWVVVRNTYGELKSTTIQSWLDWFGPSNGLPNVVYDVPIRWHHLFAYEGEPNVELTVWFLAMDRPDHVKKLKSLEVTGGWLNEASELPVEVLHMMTTRVGRYPPARVAPKHHVGDWPSWSGVIMDTNSMPDDHWWYRLAEVEQPEGFQFYSQPGGLEPDAENIQFLPGHSGYYTRQMHGKPKRWINVMIHNQYGDAGEGRAVHPEFTDAHVSSVPLRAFGGLPLWLGWDFGLTPACVVLQVTPRGRVRVLREWVTIGRTMGARQFAREVVKPGLSQHFSGMPIKGEYSIGDPGGAIRDQSDETVAIDVLGSEGMPTRPCRTNKFSARRDALDSLLTTMVDGEPGIVIDGPACPTLVRGLRGRYRYRRVQLAGDERYTEKPDKNEYSHVCEALHYPCVEIQGGGRRSSTADLPLPPRRRTGAF